MDNPSNGRVLIVEDDTLFAMLTTSQLRDAGFTCEVAGSIDAALAVMTSQPADFFDAILADIHLPDGDLQTLLPRLRSADTRTSIVLVTGSPSLQSSLDSMDHHVFAYLVKPVEPARLVETVTRARDATRLRSRLNDAEHRYRALSEQVAKLREFATPDAAPRDLDESLTEYVSLLLGASGHALAEAMDVLQLVQAERAKMPLRHLSRHPEAEMYRNAIAHTIQVLERTKSAFKSRELADLRQQLEAALLTAAPSRR